MIPGIFAGAANSGVAPSSYASEVLADSPELYCRLGETSGTSCANIGSSAATATYVSLTLGQPSLCGDPSDHSIYSDSAGSSSRRIDLATATSLKHANNFTFECIMNPDTVSGLRGMMSLTSNGSAYLRINAGKLNMLKRAQSDRGSSATTLVAGTTYHVAVTVSAGGVITFYVNGVADGNGTTTTDFVTSGNTGNLACELGGTNPFVGYLDEFAMYGTALSAGRILAHAQAAGLA